MIALHRGGRQADALAEFHRLRTRLAEELASRGADVRQAHERILRDESRVDGPGEREPILERSADELDRAAHELAAAIVRQWTAEAEMRSLNRPEPVALTWASTKRQVAATAAAVLGERADGGPDRLTLSGDLADVVASSVRFPRDS